MEAARRKSSRKGGRKAGSGSGKEKKQYPVPEAQNLPRAAISRRENRKRVFEERRKEKDDRAKREEAGKQAWFFSLEKVKALVDEGLGERAGDESESLFSAFGDEIQGILRTGAAAAREAEPLIIPEAQDVDDSDCAIWESASTEPRIIPKAKKKETIEEWEMRMRARAQLRGDDHVISDYEAELASQFQSVWESRWSSSCGAFEDNTRIPSMRFTFQPAPHDVTYESSLQIFSVKVTPTRDSLPFDVFGMVAIRDIVDHNRNIVFCRTRDNCQTLTKEHPYLVLTGPSRAVFLEPTAPVVIEADLTVKGATEMDDEKLSSLAASVLSTETVSSHLLTRGYTSKLSTVDFTLGHIVSSVEATIFVRVTRGSWPDGFHGQFSAIATGVCSKNPSNIYSSVNDEEIMLLDSGGEKVHVTGDGDIKLSRYVVSVETSGKLKVHVKAWGVDNNLMEKWQIFNPLDSGRSCFTMDIGFCEMDVIVFWSLISCHRAKSTL